MGFRQTLNEHPTATSAITGLIIVVSLVFVFRMACAGPGGGDERLDKAYFTIDDGKTYFAADARKVPPFEHEGKTAYRVRVFKCPDGSEHVSHLERYNEADRKKIQAAIDSGKPAGSAGGVFLPQAIEVKKPGAAKWLRMTPRTVEEYTKITAPKCPDGSAPVQWVYPP